MVRPEAASLGPTRPLSTRGSTERKERRDESGQPANHDPRPPRSRRMSPDGPAQRCVERTPRARLRPPPGSPSPLGLVRPRQTTRTRCAGGSDVRLNDQLERHLLPEPAPRRRVGRSRLAHRGVPMASAVVTCARPWPCSCSCSCSTSTNSTNNRGDDREPGPVGPGSRSFARVLRPEGYDATGGGDAANRRVPLAPWRGEGQRHRPRAGQWTVQSLTG